MVFKALKRIFPLLVILGYIRAVSAQTCALLGNDCCFQLAVSSSSARSSILSPSPSPNPPPTSAISPVAVSPTSRSPSPIIIPSVSTTSSALALSPSAIQSSITSRTTLISQVSKTQSSSSTILILTQTSQVSKTQLITVVEGKTTLIDGPIVTGVDATSNISSIATVNANTSSGMPTSTIAIIGGVIGGAALIFGVIGYFVVKKLYHHDLKSKNSKPNHHKVDYHSVRDIGNQPEYIDPPHSGYPQSDFRSNYGGEASQQYQAQQNYQDGGNQAQQGSRGGEYQTHFNHDPHSNDIISGYGGHGAHGGLQGGGGEFNSGYGGHGATGGNLNAPGASNPGFGFYEAAAGGAVVGGAVVGGVLIGKEYQEKTSRDRQQRLGDQQQRILDRQQEMFSDNLSSEKSYKDPSYRYLPNDANSYRE
ncbi:hypothetical protein HK096_006870 [Nowakowskiella sp. JEL0078]|nr:hypothetical protein HK096_006870 [Nowakowskiella sp. JEL0078]